MSKASSIAPDFFRVVLERVRKAVANPENRNDDGSVYWEFVDADVYMETNPTEGCRELYMNLFDEACDLVEAELFLGKKLA